MTSRARRDLARTALFRHVFDYYTNERIRLDEGRV